MEINGFEILGIIIKDTLLYYREIVFWECFIPVHVVNKSTRTERLGCIVNRTRSVIFQVI